MVKVVSINRLIKSLDQLGDGRSMMTRQVRNIQHRLNSGVDVDGKTFAPYASIRPTNHVRPLALAAGLFDRFVIDSRGNSLDHDSTRIFSASISGEAAKIARYQNFRRRFLGYSDKDRSDALDEFKDVLSGAYERCR